MSAANTAISSPALFNGIFNHGDLRAMFASMGNGIFFLQIGAMDGIAYDPIHEHIKAQHWRGLLFEPMPDMYQQLKANYAGCDGLTFINAAITDYDGTIEMTRIDPAAFEQGLLPIAALGLSTTLPGRGALAPDNPRVTPEVRQLLQVHATKLVVSCYRLETVLQAQQVEKIDLVVIDTEGADWSIARQLPMDHRKPRAIYLEYEHLQPEEKAACNRHFLDHGFQIFGENTGENFLAVRKAD